MGLDVYKNPISPIKTKIMSAAGFTGKEEDLLEANRKKLYEEYQT
jgi:predicted metallo-beta-lactamase superfamily hydrolase